MDENNQQPPQFNPDIIYPEATKGPVATESNAYQNNEPQIVYVQQSPIDAWSIALLVLLLLTFFSPLGPILFLPMIVVGIIASAKYLSKSNKTQNIAIDQNGRTVQIEQKSNPVYTALRIIGIVAVTLVLGFVGLIAVAFIALANSPRGMGS